MRHALDHASSGGWALSIMGDENTAVYAVTLTVLSPSVLSCLFVKPEERVLVLVLGPSKLVGQIPLRRSCDNVVVVGLRLAVLCDGLPMRLDLRVLPRVLMGLAVEPAHIDDRGGLLRRERTSILIALPRDHSDCLGER